MPFPKIDNDLLNIGNTNGKIPLIGAGDKLPTSLLDTGAGSNKLVQLDGDGKLPAIDASLLTNLPSPSGGVGMNLLDEQIIITPVGQIDFTSFIDNTYKLYFITFNNIVPENDAAQFLIRSSTDGGVTFLSSSGSYKYHNTINTSNSTGQSSVFSDNDGSTNIYGLSGWGNVSNEGFSGHVELSDPSNTSIFKHLNGRIIGTNSLGNCQGSDIFATIQTTLAVNGIRFYLANGNIASGTFKLYGIS